MSHCSPLQLVCRGPTKPMQGSCSSLPGVVACSVWFCSGYRGCGLSVLIQSNKSAGDIPLLTRVRSTFRNNSRVRTQAPTCTNVDGCHKLQCGTGHVHVVYVCGIGYCLAEDKSSVQNLQTRRSRHTRPAPRVYFSSFRKLVVLWCNPMHCKKTYRYLLCQQKWVASSDTKTCLLFI